MAKRQATRTSSTSNPRKSTASFSTSKRTSTVRTPGASDAGDAKTTQSGASKQTASELIDQRIRDLDDWRGQTLARMRALILQADPEMTEEWKWRGTPVWSHHGIVCTGESYKKVVKLTFARGATLPDPARLFNSSLEGSTRRAIDIHEGQTVNAAAFKALVKAAVELNSGLAKKPTKSAKTDAKTAKSSRQEAAKSDSNPGKSGAKKQGKPIKAQKSGSGVVLLSGGNPQIAKGDGDAPVQAYIEAMPGWKSGLGKRLDELIVRNVPDVRKAVKWNSPFYGIEGQGWFLSFHVFTRYVKVTFFNGASLQPIPPGGTPKSKEARWIDIYEDDEFDESQMVNWVKQSAAVPGWIP